MKAASVHGEYLTCKEWNKIRASKVTPGIPPLGSNVYSCNCSNCKAVAIETAKWTKLKKDNANRTNVCVGDRVLVHGKFPGIVRYIGDLDSTFINSKIYVGVKLDDPVGEHDGIYNGKRFFKCPPSHGIVVPLEDVGVIPIPGKNYEKRLCQIKTFSTPMMVFRPNPSKKDELSAGYCSPCNSFKMSQQFTVKKKSNASVKSSQANLSLASIKSKHSAKYASHLPLISGTKLSDVCNDTNDVALMKRESSCTSSYAKYSNASFKPGVSKSLCSSVAKSLNENSTIIPSFPNSIKSIPALSSIKISTKIEDEDSVVMPSQSYNSVSSLACLTPKSDNMTIGKADFSKSKFQKSLGDLPIPPENEINTSQWRKHIQEIKKTPKVPKIYLNTSPAAFQEHFSDEFKRRKDEERFITRTAPIRPKISYTSRLLSGLPKDNMVTPVSPNSELKDIEEFGFWLKKWGGGLRGWTMATTLQKLKDAKRKGDKEIQWQQKIDELECDSELGPQVRRIKAIHDELFELRNIRDSHEREMRIKIFSVPPCQDSLLQYQRDVKEEEERCTELEKIIRTHPNVSYVDLTEVM